MRLIKFKVFILFTILSFTFINAQNDTILVKNGNTLFGEIKKIRSGVLTMETSYSDSDFTIDFSDVVKMSVEKKINLRITLYIYFIIFYSLLFLL